MHLNGRPPLAETARRKGSGAPTLPNSNRLHNSKTTWLRARHFHAEVDGPFFLESSYEGLSALILETRSSKEIEAAATGERSITSRLAEALD